MNTPKPIGTGAPIAGRVLNKIMRPVASNSRKGFASLSPKRAREIQSAGGNSHSRAHMRRLAMASAKARRSR